MRWKPWPAMIFVLLGGNMIIVAITVTAALRTRSPIEPDYYTRALAWDDSARQTQRNAALGWTITPTFTPAPGGRFFVSASVIDGAGRPIRTASRVAIEAEGPKHSWKTELLSHDDGTYAAPEPIDCDEGMRLRMSVAAGYDLFTAEHTISAQPAGSTR